MKRTGILAVAVLSAVLAGCTTTGEKPSPSSPPLPATSTTSTVPPVTVDLPASLLARIPHFAPPPPPEKVTLPAGGRAGWFLKIPTAQKIAFITMDDGLYKDPRALRLFQAAHVPVTLFLEVDAVKDNPGFFAPLQGAGATVEDHTITHHNLKGRSYAFQRHEICGGADWLAAHYGKRPALFRPPGGEKDDNTLKAVHDCGMKAAFYWTETTDHGVIFWQGLPHRVQPGDIILMHFRPRFVDDFLAVLNAIHRAGLTPARLEDYLP